jgi:hypothetical protein
MIWSPTGPSVTATTGATAFRAAGNIAANLGGVARVCNVGVVTEGTSAATATFTIGGSGVTNTMLIPVPAGQSMYIAFGPGDTHIVASANSLLVITPGIGRP